MVIWHSVRPIAPTEKTPVTGLTPECKPATSVAEKALAAAW